MFDHVSPSYSQDFSHIYLYLSNATAFPKKKYRNNTTVTNYFITFLQTVYVANYY